MYTIIQLFRQPAQFEPSKGLVRNVIKSLDRPTGFTKMKSDIYDDWYRIDIPAPARSDEISRTLAPESPISRTARV